MKVECTLEERIGKKSNQPYLCFVIKIGQYEKVVFPEGAEKELIKMYYSKKTSE